MTFFVGIRRIGCIPVDPIAAGLDDGGRRVTHRAALSGRLFGQWHRGWWRGLGVGASRAAGIGRLDGRAGRCSGVVLHMQIGSAAAVRELIAATTWMAKAPITSPPLSSWQGPDTAPSGNWRLRRANKQ